MTFLIKCFYSLITVLPVPPPSVRPFMLTATFKDHLPALKNLILLFLILPVLGFFVVDP